MPLTVSIPTKNQRPKNHRCRKQIREPQRGSEEPSMGSERPLTLRAPKVALRPTRRSGSDAPQLAHRRSLAAPQTRLTPHLYIPTFLWRRGKQKVKVRRKSHPQRVFIGGKPPHTHQSYSCKYTTYYLSGPKKTRGGSVVCELACAPARADLRVGT